MDVERQDFKGLSLDHSFRAGSEETSCCGASGDREIPDGEDAGRWRHLNSPQIHPSQRCMSAVDAGVRVRVVTRRHSAEVTFDLYAGP